ncbi:MAG: hypothetical protein JNJ80_09325 [Gemmatimonadetes bacterium]|nr:hypothetical protein [Gemmatimonadota bacterium]MCC7133812.1 hypothetical protein [Gemmatimonadales bacterium]
MLIDLTGPTVVGIILAATLSQARSQPDNAAEWKLAAAGPLSVAKIDLNHDGLAEQAIRDPCGNSNCGFLIRDGRTGRPVADFGASIVGFRRVHVNGWPVIHTYYHHSAGEGTLEVWVFDRTKYVRVITLPLAGADLGRAVAELDRLPLGPPKR